MEDIDIVELFFQRSEEAVAEAQKKYGTFCRKLAMDLLREPRDAEECVNDTWQAAWQTIPPQRPGMLGAYLGRITRNLPSAGSERTPLKCAPKVLPCC